MFNRKFIVLLGAFIVILMGTSYLTAQYFLKDVQTHLRLESSRLAAKRLQFNAKQIRDPAIKKDTAMIRNVLNSALDQSEVTCAMFVNTEDSSWITTQLDPRSQCTSENGENVSTEIIYSDDTHKTELGILELVAKSEFVKGLPQKINLPFGILAVEFLVILLLVSFYFVISNRELSQFLLLAAEKIRAGEPVYPPKSLFLDSNALEKVLVELDQKMSGQSGRGFFSLPAAEQKARREVDVPEVQAKKSEAKAPEGKAAAVNTTEEKLIAKEPEQEIEFWLFPIIDEVIEDRKKISIAVRYRIEKPAYGGAVRVRAKENEFADLLQNYLRSAELLAPSNGEIVIRVARKNVTGVEVTVQDKSLPLLAAVGIKEVEAITRVKELSFEGPVVVIGHDPLQLKKFESVANIENKAHICRLDQLPQDHAKQLKEMDAPTFVFLPEEDLKTVFKMVHSLGIERQTIICVENADIFFDPVFAKNIKNSKVYLFV